MTERIGYSAELLEIKKESSFEIVIPEDVKNLIVGFGVLACLSFLPLVIPTLPMIIEELKKFLKI